MKPPPDPTPKIPAAYKYAARPTDDEVLHKWRILRTLGLVAGGVIALLAAGYGILRKRQEPSAQVPEVRLLSESRWTQDPGVSIAPTFSSNGKLVAYASDREGSGNLAIWLRPYPKGAPRRVTTEEFNATDPDFSPDNSQIVYHSDRDGGGVYIVPASGGGARLLAKGGLRPRFSPNGKWIAYYAAAGQGDNGPGPITSTLHIVAADGSAPRRLQPDFRDARNPVWSPYGEVLLFEGADGDGVKDWWVMPIEGGVVTRTHAVEALATAVNAHSGPMRWVQDRILFSGTDQTNLHPWEIGITPQTWQISGTPRPLTNGEGIEQSAAVGADGRIMLTRMQVSVNIWSLPLDRLSGKASGALQPVTKGEVLNLAPTTGSNATKVVYVSDRTGSRDIWVRDLKTGVDFSATSFHQIAYRPVISADENRIAFRTAANNDCIVLVRELAGDKMKQVASGCFNLWDWSPDGSNLLVYDSAEAVVSVQRLNIESGRRQTVISHPTLSVYDCNFSRDGRWVSFTAGLTGGTSEVYVAPFHDGVKVSEWTPVTKGGGSLSAWSPDSGSLYFQSKRDGFHCIWSQKLTAAKQPVGEANPVLHLHSVAFGLYMIKPNDFRMSVTKDRLLLNLASETANLWLSGKAQ